jgi:hypothetical protein
MTKNYYRELVNYENAKLDFRCSTRLRRGKKAKKITLK